MITCTVCGYDKNPDDSDFCDACGAELQSSSSATESTATIDSPILKQPSKPESLEETLITETPEPETISPPTTPSPVPPVSPVSQTLGTTARLIAKQPNAPTAEFPLDGAALIGIFDPDMGPVDVDLEEFTGNETVSRHHAEIYQDAGVWKIKDLGSTNGVFIKPMGQTRFGARITTPESLNSGDEVAIAKIRFIFQSP